MDFTPLESAACLALVKLALAEDLGPEPHAGQDVTSVATIPASTTGAADIVARSPGVLAGLPAARRVLEELDAQLGLTPHLTDGTRLTRGDRVATISGPLIALLAAERTVLNFLQRLSGVATLTAEYVAAVAGTGAAVLDTRKTTPGWRRLEKYAVRAGGGVNHRIGLSDGVLIKDNHLAGLGDPAHAVWRAVEAARRHAPAGMIVEVEVDTLEQLDQALACRPDIVLLDNMTVDQLRTAVARRDAVAPEVLLEASGGVNLQTIRSIAETGVNRISVGALTHSAPALDLALDYRDEP